MRKELTEQKAITEKLQDENGKLKLEIENLKTLLNDKVTQIAEQKTEMSSEMERKDQEISKVKSVLCNMRAKEKRDTEEIACLNALLNCPTSPTNSDKRGNSEEYFEKNQDNDDECCEASIWTKPLLTQRCGRLGWTDRQRIKLGWPWDVWTKRQ